ncbi:class I SAM-dependent methyltransferase [Methanobacterium oryzae]|uniref:class I SAM-dependent methyltransferase n=1 Tax=Methanobacterium oryzae TaxID=69540 RepID=UPI003D1FAE9E
MSFKEPSKLSVWFHSVLGHTILSPLYKKYVENLKLAGNENVIDFGSGAGALSRHIAPILLKNGGQLTCVDLSKNWMGALKKRMKKYPNVDYKLGQIKDVDIGDNSQDIVVIHYVLHDVEVNLREKTLRILVKKLKDNGRVFIREPMAENHGISTAEIRQLMHNVGLKEINLRNPNIVLIRQMTEAMFQK